MNSRSRFASLYLFYEETSVITASSILNSSLECMLMDSFSAVTANNPAMLHFNLTTDTSYSFRMAAPRVTMCCCACEKFTCMSINATERKSER